MYLKYEKTSAKVGNFSRIRENYITALATQTTQEDKSSNNLRLLIQDWIFILGQRDDMMQRSAQE